MEVKKIISGGQTGVDRAGLDFAIENRIPHGGYCPKGRISEDGKISGSYNLIETATSNYKERTEKNLIESDGTLIINKGKLSGGTLLTANLCKKHKKPLFIVDLDSITEEIKEKFKFWIKDNNIEILNIAGPRESKSQLYLQAKEYLGILLNNRVNSMYKCMGKKMQGKEITPGSIGKIRKGAYYIPDCPDYESRINIPKKIHIKDPFTGWNCCNCKNLKVPGKE